MVTLCDRIPYLVEYLISFIRISSISASYFSITTITYPFETRHGSRFSSFQGSGNVSLHFLACKFGFSFFVENLGLSLSQLTNLVAIEFNSIGNREIVKFLVVNLSLQALQKLFLIVSGLMIINNGSSLFDCIND